MLPWRTIAPRAARRASAFGAAQAPRITFGSACRHLSATAAARQLNAKVVTDGVQFDGLTGVSTRRSTLPHFWLRDNCRCSTCVNQDTTQRNFDTYAISQDIRPSEIKSEEKGIKVTWEQDGHESFYPWHFIKHYLQNDHRNPEQVNYHFWGSDVGERRPVVEYDHLMTDKDDSGVAKLTNLIREYGFAFVDGTPYDTPEPTQRVLERIAFIRETHYGGFYDFVPDLAMADTAYTNIALPAHTDTTYFTDPAGLQAFHMLSHEAPPGQQLPKDGKLGGESLLVDAFYAAQILQKEDPAAYEILSKVRLPWHASGNEGITISPDKRYPVLEVDPQTRTLQRVRWNNDDRGVVPFTDDVSPTEWYAAARKWDAILRRSDVEFWWQLKPGQVLIFDNWRVMHGRSAFEGRRRIAGAYINRDDFVSRWRNTNFPHEQVLNQVVG
ncbi:trimethyllysine dioxygenase [Colletotrichum scovillei]|uniref:Trimethyllysine dioxygenase n=1 Tax=Colletotrichum scovillei TaxID=1209932 RepID=A0A9P7RIA1_9PEZI|nr:trimethyllysine dioxygenase [Colletotrichum scovillei]KAG7076289.1 trimethyllysine dioxygenase [Colletotrichum scovillei]KAG7083467.1 trimethyllysine dioxygenase [Colletotrichum scovillei]